MMELIEQAVLASIRRQGRVTRVDACNQANAEVASGQDKLSAFQALLDMGAIEYCGQTRGGANLYRARSRFSLSRMYQSAHRRIFWGRYQTGI